MDRSGPSSPARAVAAVAADRRSAATGAVTLAVATGLLVASGCAAGPLATGPSHRPASVATTAAAAYLAIANAGNHRLDTDVDRFDGPDRADLPAARADLRDIAATERTFDQRLAQLPLPPDSEAWARALIEANEARATLTGSAAASTSLRRLDGLRAQLTAANAPVEHAVTGIRASLHLPPPDTH